MSSLANIGSAVPRLSPSFVQKLATKLLTLMNWQVLGEIPNKKKFILAVAPHTSNWDFVVAVLVMLRLRLRVTFLGKESIFVGPFGVLLRKLGGMPIERSTAHGVVSHLVDAFEHSETMVLGLSPEGTRSKTVRWKTGFLIIAQRANVPIVPVSLDFSKKQVTFLPAQSVIDDIDKELEQFQKLFKGVCAKNPQSAG